MEDDLNIFLNGRRPQISENARRPQFYERKKITNFINGNQLQFFSNGRQPQKTIMQQKTIKSQNNGWVT